MRLSFHATSTSVDEDGCGFEGEMAQFAVMYEDGRVARIWWHDGTRGQDECVLPIRVTLSPTTVAIELERTEPTTYDGPYVGLDITYDDHDDRLGDLHATFAKILDERPEAFVVID